jgi:hypothetical protein
LLPLFLNLRMERPDIREFIQTLYDKLFQWHIR